jgi:hypothetical protein
MGIAVGHPLHDLLVVTAAGITPAAAAPRWPRLANMPRIAYS